MDFDEQARLGITRGRGNMIRAIGGDDFELKKGERYAQRRIFLLDEDFGLESRGRLFFEPPLQ
jgi:hypothetical protein